jgi:hypothetical protein
VAGEAQRSHWQLLRLLMPPPQPLRWSLAGSIFDLHQAQQNC